MSNDAHIAAIGRRLAVALSFRARERTPEALKAVLAIQTELVAAVRAEAEQELVPLADDPPPVVRLEQRPLRAMVPLVYSLGNGIRPDGVQAP